MKLFIQENGNLFYIPLLQLRIKSYDTFIIDSTLELPYLRNIESIQLNICDDNSGLNDFEEKIVFNDLQCIMSHELTALFKFENLEIYTNGKV